VLIYLTGGGAGGSIEELERCRLRGDRPRVGQRLGRGRTKNRRVELVVLPNVEEMLNLNSLAQ
jgi:hypothetical protein